VATVPTVLSVTERFSKLIRAMADQEGEAALAVFFDHSVTTITNWCKGQKLPREGDIEDLVGKCEISADQLRSTDEDVWQAALERASGAKHVLVTPAWLHLKDHIALIEKATRSAVVIVLTADAHNDTQRRTTQSAVRHNISRGLHYIYVIPEGCENERSLVRFIESIKSRGTSDDRTGTAKILKTRTTRKTIRQWKRIDHVMLFAHGEELFEIEALSDIPRLQIDEGYEQLYKAGDQPYNEFAWKSLSIREIDYYKELLEEWSEPGSDEEELTASVPRGKHR